MKKIHLLFAVILLFNNFAIYAAGDPLSDILSILSDIKGIQNTIKGYESDIDNLMGEVKDAMHGHYGWATSDFQDFQTYGTDAAEWNSVLQMAENGGGSGQLGQQLNQLAQQFPINTTLMNQAVSDPYTQKYYALQAQTVLASRAASQLDYNKIQQQIDYQNELRKKIDNTDNIKSAIDLSNRIQLENNLIQLEILRQSALINQQQAVSAQGHMNDAILNANFLKN